jgi:hypothetical protein
MLHCHGSLGSDHARFLRGFALAGKRRRYPKASSMSSVACLPMLGIQCEWPSRKLDPSLTLTRTQYPATVSNAGKRKPFVYAGFATPCNAEQPVTAHS